MVSAQEPALYTSIGGQAVIEGVMMRSPGYVAVALRTPSQSIQIRSRPHSGWSKKVPILKKPVLRGVATLLESMIIGMDALGYSAEVAVEEENPGSAQGSQSSIAIAASMALAIVFGLGLFVALPHALSAWIGGSLTGDSSPSGVGFHLVDGLLKIAILLTYVYAISWMKDIHRVFQYHGAEHKAIYTFERGEDLTVENARRHSPLHPRCGTSFLLFLVLISVAVFTIVLPLFWPQGSSGNSLRAHALMVGVKILLMLPVAGLSYELIKISACRLDNPFFRLLVLPGLMLQRLTTREPTDDQLEIALASLKQVLLLEKGASGNPGKQEKRVSTLKELGPVAASVAEFPEL